MAHKGIIVPHPWRIKNSLSHQTSQVEQTVRTIWNCRWQRYEKHINCNLRLNCSSKHFDLPHCPPTIVFFSCKMKNKLPCSGNSEAIVSLLIHQPHPLTFPAPVFVPTAPVKLHLELPRSVGEVVHLQAANSQGCSVMVMGGHISFFGWGDLPVCSKLNSQCLPAALRISIPKMAPV